MYGTDDLIQFSALQHFAFCPRQCALLHVEQTWAESGRTAEGRIMHERVHDEGRESRGGVRIEYGVALRSLRLGLIGKADVVEFHRQPDGAWLPFPVEYKRGKYDPWHYINFVCFILKSAYKEFEERLGSLPQPRGEKTAMVHAAVKSFTGTFSVADIQRKCPGIGIDMIRRVLKDLQVQGIVGCLGRGRNAKWEKVKIR